MSMQNRRSNEKVGIEWERGILMGCTKKVG
jgi:hypothetical protein